MLADPETVTETKTSVAYVLSNWEEVAIRRLKPSYARMAAQLERLRRQVIVTKMVGSALSIACTCLTILEMCTDYVQLDLPTSLLVAAVGFGAGALAGGASIFEYSVERRELDAVSGDEHAFRKINVALDSSADYLLGVLSKAEAQEPIRRNSYAPLSYEKCDALSAIGAPTGRIALAALNCSDDILRAAAFALPARSAILFGLLALVDVWTLVHCLQQIANGNSVTLAKRLLNRCNQFDVKHAAVRVLLDAADQALAGNDAHLGTAMRRYRAESILRMHDLEDSANSDSAPVTEK